MVVMGTVLGVLVGGLLVLALVRWWAARAVEGVVTDAWDDASDDPAVPRMALLPEGHQPPPGLSPLSPSERFLEAEATRGMRELELYLLDAA
jgi:hypothetical protein